MIGRSEFETALRRVDRPDERFAILGALLTKATGLGPRLVVVGGSAITVYTKGRYVSGDFDVVGGKEKIVRVLKRWGFEFDGRYWVRPDLGLAVEPGRRGYSGLLSRTQTEVTPLGPVRLAAPEDLIVRRLVYAKGGYGEKSRRALDEAVLILVRFSDRLDEGYLRKEVEYERVEEPFQEMVRRARLVTRVPFDRSSES